MDGGVEVGRDEASFVHVGDVAENNARIGAGAGIDAGNLPGGRKAAQEAGADVAVGAGEEDSHGEMMAKFLEGRKVERKRAEGGAGCGGVERVLRSK